MSDYDETPDLTPEEREEFERQMEEAANDPNNPDHEFAQQGRPSGGGGFPGFAGGMIIPIMPMGGPVFMPQPRPIQKAKYDPRMPAHMKPVHNYPVYYLFNRQYVLRILDAIYSPEDDSHPHDRLTVSMEIEPNATYKGKKYFNTILEVQEYLQTSQLLNWVVAFNIGHGCAWDLHDFHFDTYVAKDYAKILVSLSNASAKAPEWVFGALDDEYQEYCTTTMLTKLDQPAQLVVHRKKHLYLPLISYDMTVAFNGSTGVDMTDPRFNPVTIYAHVIRPQIEDAKSQFFSHDLPISRYVERREDVVHCFFEAAAYGGMMKIHMDCSPAVISKIPEDPDSDIVEIAEYFYNGSDEHLIGTVPLAKYDALDSDTLLASNSGITMVAQYSSTPSSQVLPLNWINDGVVTKNDRFFMSSHELQALFSIEHRTFKLTRQEPWCLQLWPEPSKTPGTTNERMHFMSRYRSSEKYRDMYIGMVAFDKPLVIATSVLPEVETGYKIYGFVEFPIPGLRQYSIKDAFKIMIAKEDMMDKLQLPKEFPELLRKNLLGDRKYSNLTCLETYRNSELWRLMIYETWTNSKLNLGTTSS